MASESGEGGVNQVIHLYPEIVHTVHTNYDAICAETERFGKYLCVLSR